MRIYMRNIVASFGIFLTTLFSLLILFAPAPAQAYWCCSCCNCCDQGSTGSQANNAYVSNIRNGFILGSFYTGPAQTAFKQMADKISGTLLLQAQMIGGFYDAQSHLDSQRTLQVLKADAYRSYAPSESMCQFGTLAKSLGASDEKTRANQLLLSEIGLSRQLGVYGNIGSAGRGQDNAARMTYFIQNFCNWTDSQSGLQTLCNIANSKDSRFNRDIDYGRTLAVPDTINADFTNSALTDDENNLIMLAHNLYGSDQFVNRISDIEMKNSSGHALLQMMRSVEAKRALAQNSFNAIAGMKMAGGPQSRVYLVQVLKNLGMVQADIDKYLPSTPASGNNAATSADPSYYTQMKILTQSVYQDPAFYAHLMDTPSNVERQAAAMEALGLIQDRDTHNSLSRTVMLLSALVEMEAIRLQSNIQNNMTTR